MPCAVHDAAAAATCYLQPAMLYASASCLFDQKKKKVTLRADLLRRHLTPSLTHLLDFAQ
jgi:hypothetical protein